MKNYHVASIESFLVENVESQLNIELALSEFQQSLKKAIVDTLNDSDFYILSELDPMEINSGNIKSITDLFIEKLFVSGDTLIHKRHPSTFALFLKKLMVKFVERSSVNYDGLYSPSRKHIVLTFRDSDISQLSDVILEIVEELVSRNDYDLYRPSGRVSKRFNAHSLRKLDQFIHQYMDYGYPIFTHELQHAYDYHRGGKSFMDFANKSHVDHIVDREGYLKNPIEISARYTEVITILKKMKGSISSFSDFLNAFKIRFHGWKFLSNKEQKRLISRMSQEWDEIKDDVGSKSEIKDKVRSKSEKRMIVKKSSELNKKYMNVDISNETFVSHSVDFIRIHDLDFIEIAMFNFESVDLLEQYLTDIINLANIHRLDVFTGNGSSYTINGKENKMLLKRVYKKFNFHKNKHYSQNFDIGHSITHHYEHRRKKDKLYT